MIDVLMVEPFRKPYVRRIKNTEKSYRNIVNGELKTEQLDKKTVIVSNAKAKNINLFPNRKVGMDIICGTFFIAAGDNSSSYSSLTEKQISYYSDIMQEIELISHQEVLEKILNGTTGIGKDIMFINTLCMEFYEKETDFEKIANSYNSEEKIEAKELLKTMHRVFCEVHKTDCVDKLNENGEDMFYLPAVIKSRETGKLCIALVLVDTQSSGEHFETQFAFSGGFYSDCDLTDEIKPEREQIGKYDYWYTPTYEGDIHVDFSEMPPDVKEILEYARCQDEQMQDIKMESL